VAECPQFRPQLREIVDRAVKNDGQVIAVSQRLPPLRAQVENGEAAVGQQPTVGFGDPLLIGAAVGLRLVGRPAEGRQCSRARAGLEDAEYAADGRKV